ncbi:MAG: DUF2281 domain-containing protein [Bacteroidota bacterium]
MSDQQILSLIQSLEPKLQQEVIHFIESLKSKEKVDFQKPYRKAGTLKGLITYMAPDFDAPLDDMKEYM